MKIRKVRTRISVEAQNRNDFLEKEPIIKLDWKRSAKGAPKFRVQRIQTKLKLQTGHIGVPYVLLVHMRMAMVQEENKSLNCIRCRENIPKAINLNP